MKIAIPSETDQGLDGIRAGHFGHAPYFTVVEYNDGMDIVGTEVVKNVEHGPNGCGNIIDYVLSLNLDGILAVGMGLPPLTRFTNGGMTVYSERMTPNVGDAARLLAAGKVEVMNPADACQH